MPATIESVVASAHSEWKHWGESVWDLIQKRKRIAHRDDEEVFARRVLERYCSIAGGSPRLADIQDDRYYWSAVGMSFLMAGAGYTKNEFPFAQKHATFIRHFVKARKQSDGLAQYWGFRIGEAGGEPDVGDLVAYARGSSMTKERAAALFDSTGSYESHSDVVVARRPGELDVIGCNVLDSVTMKTLPLHGNGHIADTEHHWFVVLRRTDSVG